MNGAPLPNPPDGLTPLPLTTNKDVTHGYGVWSGDRNAIGSDGALDIDLMTIGEGRKFKIELRGGLFEEPGRAHTRRPALIDLDPTELQGIVDAARETWTTAVVDFEEVVAKPGGGHKPRRPFQDAVVPAVDDKTFLRIAGMLAVAGQELFALLFERSNDEQLDAIANQLKEVVRSKECSLTVNTDDFHVPWGMLYTHPNPDEKLAASGDNYDPRGFWGYQHIVVQYPSSHHMAEPLTITDGKLPFGAALDDSIDIKLSVDCIAQHRLFVDEHGGRLSYVEWNTSPAVQKAFGQVPFDHRVLYFLCHATDTGKPAKPSVLELSDAKPIGAREVSLWIRKPFSGNRPLVFLNACQAGQVSALLYGHFTFAHKFLERGAACVIGPQIEVPAVFAGEYGRRFFVHLLQPGERSPPVGWIVRDLCREFWLKRNPLGLAYSLYAGANCHVRWSGRKSP
jgi:hypothetical protein